MQSPNLKDISIWNIILAVIILVVITLMIILNYKISNTLDKHNNMLTAQTANIEQLEAKIKKLEDENLELRQTLSLYNEKNFKNLVIRISEHDRKIELLNDTIKKLYK